MRSARRTALLAGAVTSILLVAPVAPRPAVPDPAAGLRPGTPLPAARAAASAARLASLLPAAWAAAAPAAPVPGVRSAPAIESAPVVRIAGEGYIGANDLARLLEATKFWRADVRKLVLRAGDHRVTLTVDDPFAVVDERTVWLRSPVLSRRGELQAPVTLLTWLPRDSTIARLLLEPRRELVVRAPAGGLVQSPELVESDSLSRVTFPVERVSDVSVVGRGRGHFRVRLAGVFIGALPESLPPLSLVRSVQSVPAAAGCVFEFEVAPGAVGFRLAREAGPGGSGTVAVEFLRRRAVGLEEFAAEGRPAHGVRVIVLDPGHGGADAGISIGGDVEKDLALALAQRLRVELTRRLAVRVVLTREDDRALSVEERAEAANRAHADLVLSLHFDAVPGTQRSGATAWCAPAVLAVREGVAARAPVVLLPWREVAERHAVQARGAAEAILTAVELAGDGPVRLRERLPRPLLGVDAPAVMLDCATLSAIPDRMRLEDTAGLAGLAGAIADGVARWVRGG